jgi:hypothetical protein
MAGKISALTTAEHEGQLAGSPILHTVPGSGLWQALHKRGRMAFVPDGI